MATIDQFLAQQDSDSDDEGEDTVVFMTSVQPYIEDSDEGDIYYGELPETENEKRKRQEKADESLLEEKKPTDKKSPNHPSTSQGKPTKKYSPDNEISAIFNLLAQETYKDMVKIVHIKSQHEVNAHLLNVNGPYKKCIIDNGADTTVIGQGWTVIAHTGRKANVIGFDKEAAIKRGLPIVTAIAAVDINEKETVLL